MKQHIILFYLNLLLDNAVLDIESIYGNKYFDTKQDEAKGARAKLGL